MHAENVTSTIAPYDLVRKMRATFNVLGPLLARVGHATVSLPGGCAIGARPVDLHLKAFEAMGADIVIEEGYVKAAALRGLKGAHIVFPFISVGATEHTMLAAVLAQGETVLENAACEPEIADLANCLNTVGAKITGAGTPTIHIQGVAKLSGGRYDVIADRIEAGTYAIAAAATGGDVFLEGARGDDMGALINCLRHAGVTVDVADKGLRIRRDGQALQAVDIDTRPHPGFPTDLQAQFMALMTIAEGTSTIRENIFENRFMHAPELNRLGADITVRGSEAIVRGVPKLHAAQVMATDLRASVSLVIAALVAEGETMVNRVYHLDRGFETAGGKARPLWREDQAPRRLGLTPPAQNWSLFRGLLRAGAWRGFGLVGNAFNPNPRQCQPARTDAGGPTQIAGGRLGRPRRDRCGRAGRARASAGYQV